MLRDVQPLKELLLMTATLLTLISFNAAQFLNAELPILKQLSGSLTLSRLSQPLNSLVLISNSFVFERSAEISLSHPANAPPAI